MRRPVRNRKGFTLPELLITAVILGLVLTGILVSYLRSMELIEISRSTSRALAGARSRMERIRSTAFAQMKPNFDNVTFTVPGINAMGVSYVDDSDPDLLEVVVSVSWRQKDGRLFGEDANLNGVLNAGEDQNANGRLDSPVQLENRMFKR